MDDCAHREKQILGCCLLDPGHLDRAIDSLRGGSGSFYDLRHRVIYEAIIALHEGGRPVMAATVYKRLKENGLLPQGYEFASISSLLDSATPLSLDVYIEEMNEAWVERESGKIIQEVNDAGHKLEALNSARKKIDLLLDGGKKAVVDPKDACRLLFDDLERRHQLGGKLSGVGTNWAAFNRLTNGLQYGELTVIGARPSAGKTAIAVNIVDFACLKNNVPTIFVTLEMSVPSLMRRMLSTNQNVPLSVLRDGTLNEQDFKKCHLFTAATSRSPIYFLDHVGSASIGKIASEIRGLVRRHKVKLVIIDYLQKIKPSQKQEKKTYEVGDVSGALKSCAVETGAAFLVLAQLSREPDKDKGRPPRLSDLADSAQIERDADTVALLHRPKTADDPHGECAALIVAKQRDGEIGPVRLRFEGRYCRFENAIV